MKRTTAVRWGVAFPPPSCTYPRLVCCICDVCVRAFLFATSMAQIRSKTYQVGSYGILLLPQRDSGTRYKVDVPLRGVPGGVAQQLTEKERPK